jgi:tRNA dimethylallyltransferase
MKKIILLSGPTATGKSSLASKLAEKIDGEIINADSIQLYRDLFILTARPNIEKEKIKHHCYGILEGDINWSVGNWIDAINEILKEVINRKKVPIVVGGTGFYFKAITDGLSPIPDIDKSIRLKIENELEKNGLEELQKRLAYR